MKNLQACTVHAGLAQALGHGVRVRGVAAREAVGGARGGWQRARWLAPREAVGAVRGGRCLGDDGVGVARARRHIMTRLQHIEVRKKKQKRSKKTYLSTRAAAAGAAKRSGSWRWQVGRLHSCEGDVVAALACKMTRLAKRI
jgi:hypothetical protein